MLNTYIYLKGKFVCRRLWSSYSRRPVIVLYTELVRCHMQMHGFVLDVSTQRPQVFCGKIFMYSGVSDSWPKQRASTFVTRSIIYIFGVGTLLHCFSKATCFLS